MSGNTPELMQVAELIDSLERLYRFVDELGLQLHIGHLLGNVVIGVARTLVTLGDTKSKKYASEWSQKVTDYVENFESDDMKKVLTTLQVAWQKEEEEQDSNKRAKLS
jgi:deoxyinosine 3'endonuclease (endonuclease V)